MRYTPQCFFPCVCVAWGGLLLERHRLQDFHHFPIMFSSIMFPSFSIVHIPFLPIDASRFLTPIGSSSPKPLVIINRSMTSDSACDFLAATETRYFYIPDDEKKHPALVSKLKWDFRSLGKVASIILTQLLNMDPLLDELPVKIVILQFANC